ncbi:MAG: transporter associated domain-containing protein [Pseudomonadota bacterium]
MTDQSSTAATSPSDGAPATAPPGGTPDPEPTAKAGGATKGAPTVAEMQKAAASDTANSATNGVEPGKELVVLPKDERSETWFMRFLVRIGLRSGGTLRDDLHEALSGEGDAGDLFSPEERAMLQNILRLRERRVEDVMVPRVEIQAVDLSMPLGSVLQRFEETGHSRLPVYTDGLDDPRGMVLIKDLMLYMVRISGDGHERDEDGFRPLDLSRVDLEMPLQDADVIRRVLFVPHSMLASDLMARMQTTRTQMALVIDEYGGTDGLVSLEDIVEEVVGEIEDEHDDEDENETHIVHVSEGVWDVNARCELDELRAQIGDAFQTGDAGEDRNTLGGLAFELAGHVPVRGEVVTGVPGFEFRILEADPRRIRRVQVVHTGLREKRRKAALRSPEAI